ncbi:MAG: type II toxin-antitoxin system RelE/ParE family toxin [Spirochaetia bacterium]|nr:type II toxin-antitoxin system RelE/ParE family toxin [Spirochaetia bacterium]
MKILYSKKFLKDIEHINEKRIKEAAKKIIENTKNIENISEIKNIRKMIGFESYYRIRINDYRLGLKYENNQIIFLRIKHRKDIYKIFP